MMMKTLLTTLVMSIAVISPIAAQEVPAPVLTLEDAIATAVANSPGLAIARERVQRAGNVVNEARGRGRFNVSADAAHTRTSPTSSITIPGPGGETQTIQTRPPSQTTLSATASQPIDINGRIRLGRQAAGLGLDIQTFGEVQTLQQLIADVKNSYYNVLRAEGGVDVVQAAIVAAEDRLRLASAQFEAGVVPRFDVTRAEVDVANLRQSLIQAENAVDIAKGALNVTIGVGANNPVNVESQAVPVEPVTVDIPAQTRQAVEARPEVRLARLAVDLAQQNVRLTAKEDDPSLAAFVRTDWISETSAFSANKTTYTYGVNLNWPVFTGGVTKARVAQARNDVQIARRSLDQTVLGVTLDVRTAAENVMESSRRVQTAEANVALAQEALRLAKVRYQEGVSTEVEVTDAESALTQALTNAVNARYDFLTAQAQLQRATASQPEFSQLAPGTPQGENK